MRPSKRSFGFGSSVKASSVLRMYVLKSSDDSICGLFFRLKSSVGKKMAFVHFTTIPYTVYKSVLGLKTLELYCTLLKFSCAKNYGKMYQSASFIPTLD